MRLLHSRRLAGLRAFLCAAAALTLPVAADELYWDFGSAAPGSAVTSSVVPGLSSAAPPTVSHGNNNGAPTLLSTTSTSRDYAGASASYNAGAAARIGALDVSTSAYFEVTITPEASNTLTISGVSLGSRSTGTGPKALTVRSSVDDYAADLASVTASSDGLWALHNMPIVVTSGSAITLRIFGSAGAGSPASGTTNWRIDDLRITLTAGQTGTPAPTITDVSPLTGIVGTPVTITGTEFGASPVVRFNGVNAPGSTVNPEGSSISTTVPVGASIGKVSVSTGGGTALSASDFVVIAQPAITLTISPRTFRETATNPAATGTVSVESSVTADLVVALSSSAPGAVTVPASVTILADSSSATFDLTAVHDTASNVDVVSTISASADGYDPDTETVTVQNADFNPVETTVVVNKLMNGSPDTVELLVVGNGTAGTTLDMRGMLIKDFGNDMTGDGGGVYEFKAVDLFSAVKVGTLIVLTANNTSVDTDPSDFVLRVGLQNTDYFTSRGGTFNVAAIDMVMVKGAGSPTAGVAGSIHVLGIGTPAAESLFTDAPVKKLLAGTGGVVTWALNSTSTLDDFNGTGAASSANVQDITFGSAMTAGSNVFIRTLRGELAVDGLGTASITNETPGSLLLGKNLFQRGSTAATLNMVLSNNGGPADLLTSVKVAVPAGFGVPEAANITLSGAGTVEVQGQDILITSAGITPSVPLTLSVGGLTVPVPSGAEDDGRYPFTVQTAGDGGVLTNISLLPAAVVTVPVLNLRDVNADGVAVDAGKRVAVEVVITEEDFDSAVRTSAFGQDGDYGINIFLPGVDLGLVLGNKYLISGTIIQFNGLTEISPGSAADVIDLGSGTSPAPLVVTVANLLANAEAYEGRLVRVNGLGYVSGTWATSNTVVSVDGAANNLDIRIQSGSTAFTTPSFPVNITGIFGQFDSSNPFTSGYQIMPRTDADVESLGGGVYYDWANLYSVGGPQEDSDGDGVPNMVEYATGTLPNDPSSKNPPVFDYTAGTFTVVKGAPGATDAALQYIVETSTDLTNWTTTGLELAENSETRLSYIYTGTEKAAYFRLKLVRP